MPTEVSEGGRERGREGEGREGEGREGEGDGRGGTVGRELKGG